MTAKKNNTTPPGGHPSTGGEGTTPPGQAGHPSTGGELATDKQVRYLHGLYRQLCWDEDMYRQILQHNYGVNSTRDLSKAQAFGFIARLQNITDQLGDRITDKQAYLVRQLWRVIDYAQMAEGDVYLNKFIVKRFGKATLTDLTKGEAVKLIKQIGQMTKQAEARKGKTTVLKRRTRCAHCGEWIMWVELKDGRREAFDCQPAPAKEEKEPPRPGKPDTPPKEGNFVATDFHKCR